MDDQFEENSTKAPDHRPRGVNKNRLQDIDLAPKLAIFFRPNRHVGVITVEKSFPKEAATTFCDRIKSDIEASKSLSYVITGGDVSAYQLIFKWILDCVSSQSIEKFPDIPEPENDAFTPTLNVILAGENLGIPAGSLSFFLEKRLRSCARKHLMPFSQVREFYTEGSDAYELGLSDVACSSIFNAWWDARLDETVNPELMEELSDMRDEIADLDRGLHEACAAKEEQIRKVWAEKKAKKLSGNNDPPATDQYTYGNENNGTVTNYDTYATDHANGNDTSTWNATNNGASMYEYNWNSTNVEPFQQDSLEVYSSNQVNNGTNWGARTVDGHDDMVDNANWADEMNDPAKDMTQHHPVTQQVPSIGW